MKTKKLSASMIVCCIALMMLNLSAATFADTEDYTYKLTQSTSAYQVWTTPPSERVFKDSEVPSDTGSEVKVYTAKNEFEPFQIIVKATASGNIKVSIGDFGSGITTEIYQVKYVNITQATDSLGKTGYYPDPLFPLENGASVSLAANENTSFWFSISVSETTPSGDYTVNAVINGIKLPVKLHVFNFAIPDELHVKSQMNFSFQEILAKYGVSGTDEDFWFYVDKIKQYFIDHRLTSSGPVWPTGITNHGGGYNSSYSYDCNGGALTETEPNPDFQFEKLADKYLNGNGFNDGTGFSSYMVTTFQNNDASADQRPTAFCGETLTTGDWYTGNNPNTSYNKKWFQYMTSLQNYLKNLGYLDKSYFYFANEPQDQADYDAVAWYSQELKKAAPNLKLMVSEEPKTEIYNHPLYTGAKIDIWLPVLNQYNPDVSHDREKNHNEETWIYFLHGTRPPYFNPITLDHPGIESKLTGWLLWKYRIRGIAYYSMNDWSKNPWTDPMNANHNGDLFMLYPPSQTNSNITYGSNNHRLVPSIRFELMRDSLEDYEYLYMLNSGNPEIDKVNAADTQSDKIISGLISYTRDSEFMYNLRRLIGLKNGNEITSIPDIQPPALHPRSEGDPGNYYINFQDPNGKPATTFTDGAYKYFTYNSKDYLQIGWNNYDQDLGYGWYGDMAHVMYQYYGEANELQKSIIYDDYGREKTFEFDLPVGTYNVTVSVGWYNKTYSHHKITIEGISFVNDEATTPSNPYLVRTKEVTVSDNKLTMNMGIFDEYTMLNYLEIEAINSIDIKDAILALQIIAGMNPAVNIADDVNNDNKIGLDEAIYILQKISGLR